MSSYLVPLVKDTDNRYLDIVSRLISSRVIMLNGEINDESCNLIVSQLLYLESVSPDLEIFMYINSPGGHVTSALGIYDIMQYIRPRITTICIGQACSAASMIFCAGEKRLICPNARILLHQPLGSASGQVSDIEIYANESKYLKENLINIYNKHTKISKDRLKAIMDRDTIFRGSKAIELGLADEIICSRKGAANE